MQNEFIIGLGGVGGQCIREFRKSLATRADEYALLVRENYLRGLAAHHLGTGCVENEARLELPNLEFEYLYIDSCADILDAPGWKVGEQSLSLKVSDVILLKEDGMGAAAPEQRGRRYGRTLFAAKADDVWDALVQKIGRFHADDRNDGTNFRIFCSAGGATGSGAVVDMVAMINTVTREWTHRPNVYLYLFVGWNPCLRESDAGQDDVTGFRANEYATLRDINALMEGTYHPHCLAGRADDTCARFYGRDPITQVVISSELALGCPSLPRQVEKMAAACLDSMLFSAHSAYVRTFLNPFPTNDPEFLRALRGKILSRRGAVEPGECESLRSRRYAAYGVCRWRVPESAIAELLKCDCEKRVLEAWLHGTPQPGASTRCGPLQSDAIVRVLQQGETIKLLKQKMETLLIHLREMAGDAREDGRHISSAMEKLSGLGSAAVAEAQGLMSDSAFLALMDSCHDRDAAALVKTIREGIDKAVMWQSNGDEVWGLREIALFLDCFEREIIHLWPLLLVQDILPSGEYGGDLTLHMKQSDGKCRKLGILDRISSHREKQQLRLQLCDAERQVQDAFVPVCRQAIKALCSRVAKEVEGVRESVLGLTMGLEERRAIVEAGIHRIHDGMDLKKCAESGLLIECDSGNLQKVRDAIAAAQREFRDAMAAHFSPAWSECIGSLADYAPERLEALCSLMESYLCYKVSQAMHDEVCDKQNLPKILVCNIIEHLAWMAGPDEKAWGKIMEPKVQALLKWTEMMSCTCVDCSSKMDNQHIAPVLAFAFGMPGTGEGRPMFNWLRRRIPHELSCFHCEPDIVECYGISVTEVSICNFFIICQMPACFVKVVQYLHGAYTEIVQAPGGENVAYHANIDDDDIGLDSRSRPPLVEESGAETWQ